MQQATRAADARFLSNLFRRGRSVLDEMLESMLLVIDVPSDSLVRGVYNKSVGIRLVAIPHLEAFALPF